MRPSEVWRVFQRFGERDKSVFMLAFGTMNEPLCVMGEGVIGIAS